MSLLKNAVALTAIPVIAGTAGFVLKKFVFKKHGLISEEITNATKESIQEIDTAVVELKSNLEDKSADQLERTLDSVIDSAKKRLDTIASQLKTRLKEREKSSHSGQYHAKYS